jgi:hypothetical protein
MTAIAIDRFCAAIASARVDEADVFCEDVLLDATVPNWHFVRQGCETVRAVLSGWFTDSGRFSTLRRTPLADGELVEFELVWDEGGGPHAYRQVHILSLRDGRIARDTMWCGGRWTASMLAEMEEAQRAADPKSESSAPEAPGSRGQAPVSVVGPAPSGAARAARTS